MDRPVRRIVTGHDATGRSVFLEDGAPPQFNATSNARINSREVWNTTSSPAIIHASEAKEPNDRPMRIPPSVGGTIIRIVDIHPGNHHGMAKRPDGRPSSLHRTATIDYAVCLWGEIYAVLDDDEKRMEQGDMLIQRGTDHAWENRSDSDCRMLFMLVDAEFSPELKALLPNMLLNDVPPSLQQ